MEFARGTFFFSGCLYEFFDQWKDKPRNVNASELPRGKQGNYLIIFAHELSQMGKIVKENSCFDSNDLVRPW